MGSLIHIHNVLTDNNNALFTKHNYVAKIANANYMKGITLIII